MLESSRARSMVTMTSNVRLNLPPWILAYKAVRKARRLTQRAIQRSKDGRYRSYSDRPFSSIGALPSYLQPLPIDQLFNYKNQIIALCDFYMAHRFDLLGSGWVNVYRGMDCRGMEGIIYH